MKKRKLKELLNKRREVKQPIEEVVIEKPKKKKKVKKVSKEK